VCILPLDKMCNLSHNKFMLNTTQLADFTQRLVPLTYFRRNAGEVLDKLSRYGNFVLTKDGQPVAKLSFFTNKAVSSRRQIEADLKKVKKLAGGFRLGGDLTPEKINQILDDRYAEMLP